MEGVLSLADTDAVCGPVCCLGYLVQDELLAELEEMEEEEVATKLLEVPQDVSLPTVPETEPGTCVLASAFVMACVNRAHSFVMSRKVKEV